MHTPTPTGMETRDRLKLALVFLGTAISAEASGQYGDMKRALKQVEQLCKPKLGRKRRSLQKRPQKTA